MPEQVDDRVRHLFSPVTIGKLSIPNRLAITGHSTGLNDGPHVTDALIAYYVARARSGLGLIITGATSVDPSSTSRLRPALSMWDDSIIPGYRLLADAVRPYGTRIFAQLNHAGALSGAPGPEPILAPSAVEHELATETPHALDLDQIARLIEAFAAAASRAQRAGLDGVELHGGHGNLIQQFLSPRTNRRTDRYGELRRFAEEVIRVVRARVGPDHVVGMRVSAQEDEPGGLTLQHMRETVPALVACGLDYLNVTSGSDLTAWSLAQHYAPMYLPHQHMRGLARAIRAVAGVPVIAVGRIVHPAEAEDLLRAGDADLVGMTRALIADPSLPEKARRGAFERIRPCVGLNEGCLGRLFRGQSITCSHNPVTGREHMLLPLQLAAKRLRVAVIGGGVAGLEAARVAAERGHQVVLLERSFELGGQVALAAKAPGRGEIGRIVAYQRAELERLGVDLRTGVDASLELVAALAPDAVIVATGARPALPSPGLHSAWAVLDGASAGERVIVFDSKGDMVGGSTAEFLARRGHHVTFVTNRRTAFPLVELMTAKLLRQRLLDLGVAIHVDTEFNPATPADTVVFACGAVADDTLFAALREAEPHLPLHLVGDAAAPRDIERAVAQAHLAARAL